MLGSRDADTGATTCCFPCACALDTQLDEDFVNGANELVHLFEGMAGSDSDAETLFPSSDGGIVDGLYVDVVFFQQFV